jgi:uncharacterized protein
MKTITGLLLSCMLLISAAVFSQDKEKSLIDNPPKLIEYVTDETNTLTSEQLVSLRKKLRGYFDSTSTQIVVYMVNSLNGEPIEAAAISIAVKNKIGKKDRNNGLLLLIAKDEHKIRIEVGYGLEGAITDARSIQIIKNDISPYFKTGEFYKGIDKGTDAIILSGKGEYTTTDVKQSREEKSYGPGLLEILLAGGIPVGIVVIIIVAAIVSAKRGGGFGRGTYVSGSGYSSSSSTSYSSDYSSSDSSSSSSSDSGFSGGGGDFGGGGASGDW